MLEIHQSREFYRKEGERLKKDLSFMNEFNKEN
jgi:hypothetical protein